MIKNYEDMLHYDTFEDRLKYLMIPGLVGEEKFGDLRCLNQDFYSSYEWREVRRKVIVRDLGLDLAVPGYEIFDPSSDKFRQFKRKNRHYCGPIVHHINPISIEDIVDGNPLVLDLNNLVLVSDATHRIIHYGSDKDLVTYGFVERRPNDTCPWREVING